VIQVIESCLGCLYREECDWFTALVWGKKEIGATRFAWRPPLAPLSIYILNSASPTVNHRPSSLSSGFVIRSFPLPSSFLSPSALPLHITPPPSLRKSPRQRDPRALKLESRYSRPTSFLATGAETGPALRDALHCCTVRTVQPSISGCEWGIPVGLCFISHLALVARLASRFVTAVELDSPVDP
jgi:hypothetical protein